MRTSEANTISIDSRGGSARKEPFQSEGRQHRFQLALKRALLARQEDKVAPTL